MAESIDLKRFLDAQDGSASTDGSPTACQVALKEILSGKKTSHWIWYIFPQGPFGETAMAKMYAITSPAEATAFLQNPVLRSRLLEITNAVASQLKTGVHPETLMGSKIDCLKLVSSMTLFKFIADELNDHEFNNTAKNILGEFASHGWLECTRTLDWLQNFSTN